MTVKEQIELNIVSVMKENSVILASDNFILNNNCGKVSFNLDVSLNISHSEEFRNNLEKLIDCDSPIADDGYAGGEISDLHSEVFYYKVLHNFVFIENREVSLKILKVKSGVDLNGVIQNSDIEVVVPSNVTEFADKGYIAYTGNFTGFSQFMLADPLIVLPVQLINFKAKLTNI